MFSLNYIVLPSFLSNKFSFLNHYLDVQFGGFIGNIGGGLEIIYWIPLGFIIIILFKNSIELLEHLKYNKAYLIFNSVLLLYSLGYMNKVSEFLYFNF